MRTTVTWPWVALGGLLLVLIGFILFMPNGEPPGTKLDNSPSEEVVKAENQLDSEAELERSAPAQLEQSSQSNLVKLFGTVSLAETGQAVSNAKVQVIPLEAWKGEQTESSLADDQGRFEFTLAKPAKIVLYAEKQNLISYESMGQVNQIEITEEDTSVGPLHLKMYPATRLNMRVVSTLNGELLPGAGVKNLKKPKVIYRDDDNGILSIPLSEEIVRLMVWAPGHELKQVNVNLTSAFQEEIEVALAPGGRIFGTVHDSKGNPVENAYVLMDLLNMQSSTQSDKAGKFELDHIPLKRQLFIRAFKQDVGSDLSNISLDSGSEQEVNFLLEPSKKRVSNLPGKAQVEGFVVDVDDIPIEDALVTFDPFSRGKDVVQVRTNAEGFFNIEVLKTRGYRQALEVSKPGYAFQYVKYESNQTEPFKVKVVLEAGHFLEGRVVSKTGNPIPEAKLFIRVPESRVYQRRQPVLTDHQGQFRLDDLPAQIDITVSAEGYTPLKGQRPKLDRKDVELVMDGLGRLQGRVIFKESGEPVTSYKAFLQKTRRGFVSFSSSDEVFPGGLWIQAADGSFLFENLEVGEQFFISIEADGYGLAKPAKVKIAPPEEQAPLVLELEPFKDQYAGVVMTTDQAPISDVDVTLVCSSSLQWIRARRGYLGMSDGMGLTYQKTQRTDASGRFVFEDVPDNTYVFLECAKQGFATALRDDLANLEEPQKKALSIRLFRGATLVTVIEKDPLPKGTDLRITSHEGSFLEQEDPVPGVDIVTPNLPPGGYRLVVEGPFMGMGNPRLTIKELVKLEEGETRRVVLSEGDKRKISGFAMIGQAPAANRQLVLELLKANQDNVPFGIGNRVGETDQIGRFEFEDLHPGLYKLMLISRQASWGGHFRPQSGNDVRIALAGEDIDETFSFKQFSKVKGRLINGKGVGGVLLSKHPYLASNGYQAVVKLDHSFELVDVEPGSYSLHLLRGQPAAPHLVVRDIAVPEDGSDVDLGDVEVELVGQIRLTMNKTWIPEQLVYANFVVYSSDEVFTRDSLRTLPKKFWSNTQTPKLVKNLPEGEYGLAILDFSGGYTFQPLHPRFEIRADETSELLITPVPITFFRGRVPSDLTLASAEMIHQQSGQKVIFELRKSRDLMEVYLFNTSYAFISGQALVAGGLPEGDWQLSAVYQNGNAFQRHLFLQKGKVLKFTLDPN